MHLRMGIAASVVVLLGTIDVLPAAAQGRLRETVAVTALVEQPLDVSKLGVDVRRIRRELVRVTVQEQRDGNNLRYLVDVFGIAPSLELFLGSRNDPNFFTGPAPFGAPTHRDFLNLNTPQQHRTPAADFGGLLRWLGNKTRDRDTPKR